MEAIEWMHYCEDPRHKRLVLCDVKDLADIKTWTYAIPYESLYLFDSVRIGRDIYFTGGGTPSSEEADKQFHKTTMRMKITDEMKSIAEKLADMNVSRADHSMETIDGKYLYVVGGVNADGLMSSCEEYEIEADKWREIAPLNEKKKWVSLCSFNSKYLYSFGGCITSAGEATAVMECLDTGSPAAWTVVKLGTNTHLLPACCLLGAVPVGPACVLLFGGVVKGKETDLCLKFDAASHSLTKEKALLHSDSFCRTRAGLKGESFAIVGSREGGLHVYDGKQQKWSYKRRTMWNAKDELGFKSDTI